jgi:hypothetical protein
MWGSRRAEHTRSGDRSLASDKDSVPAQTPLQQLKSFPGKAVPRRAEKMKRNKQRDVEVVSANEEKQAFLMKSVSYDTQTVETVKEGKDSRADELQDIAAGGTDSNKLVSKFRSSSAPRTEKFEKLLQEQIVNLDALRELAWSGIPVRLRPLCWRLLLGYLPLNRELREGVLTRKRNEYRNLVEEYYNPILEETNNSSKQNNNSSSDSVVSELRQVSVDVPRTAPDVPFFHQEKIQKSLERILFIWGMRHPASGYVQGINDVATPFLAVYFYGEVYPKLFKDDECACESGGTPGGYDVDYVVQKLNEGSQEIIEAETGEVMLNVEADAYWCLCKMLDGIQDHYTYAQPGIQKTLFRVGELVSRVDHEVSNHLAKENVQYMQFAFRWVNCLLLRELPFQLGIRLWDTYLSEGNKLKDFLVYVLSSFLLSWTPELVKMDFQEIIMFLQRPPTPPWTEREVELVLSRAYMWRSSFQDAASHLV